MSTQQQNEQEEKDTSRKALIPNCFRDLWTLVSAAPGKCGPRKAKSQASKDKGSVGKEIGIIYGSYLILNTIIGPGIFTSPKGVIQGAGSVGMSLVIWGICGVFSTMAALCFAELRESVKRDGVEYAYITEAFGPLAGFVYCWMRIAAAEPCGTAVFAVALADYTADTIYDDCAPPDMLRKSIAILAVVSMALLNVFSLQLADKMQILATVGKTVACAVIIYFGLKNIVRGETAELRRGFEGTVTGPTSITFAFYNGLWAYGGWSNVNHVTSGLRKPPRNVPRLVKTVIPLVMVIYGLVVTSYFTVMSREEMLASQAIGVTWAERTFEKINKGLVAIIPIGVGLTALGSLNATFLSAGRLSGVAVKDGNMPEVTSWIHVRSKTPILTVYTRLVIAIIMILVAEIAELVRFFIFSVWLFHGMSILALLVLRFKNKDKVRPYKVNLVLPVIVVSVIAFLVIGPFLESPKPEFVSSLVLIALSLVFYLPSRWMQSRTSMPDKFIVWLQLFFRIAPKRDSRRKSIMRRLSAIALARNSILVPAGASPATIRRIHESPSVRRRLSRASVFLDVAASPALIRRVERHRSLAEADVKRGRSNSLAVWLENSDGVSPVLVRRRPSRQVSSFGSADKSIDGLPKEDSLQNHPVVLGKELEGENGSDTDVNHLQNNNSSNYVRKVSFSFESNTQPTNSATSSPQISTTHLPHGVSAGSGLGHGVDVGDINVFSRSGNLGNSVPVTSSRSESQPNGQTTDPSSVPPVLPLLKNIPLNSIPSPIMEESYLSSSPSLSSNQSPTNQSPTFRRSAFTRIASTSNDLSLPGSSDPSNNLGFSSPLTYTTGAPSVNRNASSRRYSLNIDASSRLDSMASITTSRRHSLSNDLEARGVHLDVVGEYDSDGGGQYEILALPSLLDLARAAHNGSQSSSSSSSDDENDDDDWRIKALFESSTDTDSDSSSTSSSLNEEGSVSSRRGGYSSEDSELGKIVFMDNDRNLSYI